VLKKKKQRAAPTELGPGQQWQRVFSLLERRLPNEILLAIPYLACFWLREPVLPTDIVRCGFCIVSDCLLMFVQEPHVVI
jgi:hypothetical protein